MKAKKEQNERRKVYMGCIIFGAICIVAMVIILFATSSSLWQKQKQYENLAAKQTFSDAVTDSGEGSESDTAQSLGATEAADNSAINRKIDFADLQENTNADIYAWIYIPDTMIDYPVLHHITDNSYYLNHNIDGSKGYPGCIYTEMYNKKNFTDVNTVIYGHNMKNGTMFGGLHKYADSAYMEEHPEIYIYTADKTLVYEIFAAYEYSDIHLMLNFDYNDSAEAQKYLKSILQEQGNINTDVEFTEDSRIITLSTCVADKPDKRYLVQAILKED